MNNMKTAMQELIEYLDDTISVSIKQKFLEKEKKQIENAFDLGRDEVTSIFLIDGEDYYNKSYNQNK